MNINDYGNFFELEGQTVKELHIEEDGSEVHIKTETHDFYLYHAQDCCEWVRVVEVDGVPDNIIGQRITFSEQDNRPGTRTIVNDESHTWTSFELRTNDHCLRFYFLGESNGYYGETVNIKKSKINP